METYIIKNVKDKSMFISELQKVNNYSNIRIKVLAVMDSDIKITISRRFKHTYPINMPTKYKHLKIERVI